jgi:hypothetical protein
MIFAVILVLTDAGSEPALRSRETFQTVAACEAWVKSTWPEVQVMGAVASARAGRPVTLRAVCRDMRVSA